MIPAAVVNEIQDLLGGGKLSQREIARRVGVSRGTVNAIARGKRRDRTARRPHPVDRLVAPKGPPKRCPTCGGLVTMPCLACQLRMLKRPRNSGTAFDV